jgi:DNA-binding LacI/PurR family transcriptional regulator
MATTETQTGVEYISPNRREHGRRKHERLRSQLLGEMAIGRLRPGDALPSEKELAHMLRVSRTTVRQALGALEEEGLVRRVQGKGTFISERPSEPTTTRTSSFAMVVNEVSTGYYPNLLAEFERVAKKFGRSTVVCSSNNDVAQQADHLMHLIHGRVTGIALNPCSTGMTPAYQVQVVQEAGIPIVLLHRQVADVKAPVLLVPQREVGYRAGQLIVEAGHRRVAFFSGFRAVRPQDYEQGFREALQEAGVDLPDEFIDCSQIKTNSSGNDYQLYEDHLETCLGRMLAGPNRPTALFATFDSMSEIIFLVVGKLGLRIPEDLSLVSYGGSRREGAVMRRLTAITIDEVEEARSAARLLVEMQEGRRAITSSEEIVLSLGCSPGQTLGPPPEGLS